MNGGLDEEVGETARVDAVREMKDGWPFGVALRGEAPNHHMLRWLKTVVVSDVEKAPVRCQVGTRKMSEPEPLLTCRYVHKGHRNRGHAPGRGSRTWRVPDDWLGGVRH
jgi:hypothetical protein